MGHEGLLLLIHQVEKVASPLATACSGSRNMHFLFGIDNSTDCNTHLRNLLESAETDQVIRYLGLLLRRYWATGAGLLIHMLEPSTM